MGIFLLLLLLFCSLPSSYFSTDLYTLIYKGCASQTFTSGPAASQPALTTLASTLSTQSTTSKFFKTSTSSSSSQTLFGLFQCRTDLSTPDCSSCISHLLPLWTTLCPSSVAARVHLSGCYALYQVSTFPKVSGTQLLFKTCSSGAGQGGDFEVRRDTAFANLQTGVTTSGGFFSTSYQGVYAMAQCEGDLSVADCGECVSQAVQKSEVECGGASSGQVYLDKCYISYGNNGGSSGGGGGGEGGGQQTGKTVAIVVGGAAGLGFLVIFLLFARSLTRKKDDF